MRPVSAKRLGEALGRKGDDRVRGGEDGAARTVVALKRHHMRRGIEGAGEVENVAHRCGAEGVDRLRVIADNGQAAPIWPKPSTISPCRALVSWYSSTSR